MSTSRSLYIIWIKKTCLFSIIVTVKKMRPTSCCGEKFNEKLMIFGTIIGPKNQQINNLDAREILLMRRRQNA